MVLYKKELTNKIAGKTGFKKQDIREMLDTFREIVYGELQEDNTIVLKNLFKIQPITMKPRERFNPLTRETEYIKEHKAVKMVPSETLKQIIRRENMDTDVDANAEKLAIERQIAALQAKLRRI